MTDGKRTMKILTPLRAMRAKCLDCSGGELKQVRECPIQTCALWPYRMGKRPETTKTQSMKRTNSRREAHQS